MKTKKITSLSFFAKQIQVCGLLLALATPALSQTSGRITYNEKIKLVLNVEGNAEQDMINSLPKEHTMSKELLFNTSATLYRTNKQKEAIQETQQMEEEGAHVMIKMKAPEDKVFCDLVSKVKTEQRDFMSRLFLVESNLSTQHYKLTGNQKTILNYPCQEALLKDSTKAVSVWFTSALPVSSGPNGYGNLPGLILEADIENGRIKIAATKIELQEIDPKELRKPKEGKKVSKNEFEKIKEEKRKEMDEQNGGNGNVIIKIKN